MRRLYTLFFYTSLSVASSLAQTGTGFVDNGYYRIKNFATDRFIYVTDNKDYYDETRDREDFQAIQLWKDASKAISEPASVIYIVKLGSTHYDLQAQGTGVRELTGYTVNVKRQDNGTYEVSASRGTVTKYLSDDRTSSSEQGTLGTRGKLNYRKWVVDKIDTNHATNYFGVKPTVEFNGKYYQPFYADFAFKVASPNMHVYYVSKVAGNIVTMQEIEGEIPANTPVVIECVSANTSDNRLELLKTETPPLSGNKLVGVYFCNGDRPKESTDAYTEFNSSTMRLLTFGDNKLVFTNNDRHVSGHLNVITAIDWSTYDDIFPACIPANTCYLKADAGTPNELDIRFVGVGIDEILAEKKNADAEGVYTLSGTQLRQTNDVNGLPAGLYIVGGVKVAIK